MEYFSLTYHALLLAYYLFITKYALELDFKECTDPIVNFMAEYSARYFTAWNMCIQIVFLILALSVDILHFYPDRFSEYKRTLSLLKGYITTSVLFPIGIYVCIVFWTLYCTNRDWVLPAAVDPIFPLWLNHSVHTVVVIPPILEILTTNQFMPSFKAGLIGLNSVMWPYFALLFYTYYECGMWLYGILNAVKFHEAVVLMTIHYLGIIVLMRIGIFLQYLKRRYSGQITVKCKSSKSDKVL